MFSALGRFVVRRRVAVVLSAVVVTLLSGAFGLVAGGNLSTGGWIGQGSESAIVAERLERDFGGGGASLVVIYLGGEGTDARAPGFQEDVADSLAGLRDDPIVLGTTGYADLPDERFIATDGTGTFVVVDLALDPDAAVDHVARLRTALGPIDGVDIDVSGHAAATFDANELTRQDLLRAEALALPLALVILIAVFASLVAAGLPLVVAALAIVTTLGLISVLAATTEMSIFVLNLATMLGLALAIDYSLFLVARFREELRAGRSTEAAVERAVASVGKAIVFSGIAVGIGLSGLMFFRSAALTSMGVAGVIVVSASALYAVTFLPALLAILGPNVDRFGVRGLGGRVGLTRLLPAWPGVDSGAFWGRLAARVMAHPWRVLVPTLALLLLLGAPFIALRQAVPDADIFPPGMEARDGAVALQERFPPGETVPITVLADVSGDPTGPENAVALAGYATAIAALDGIVRVDGPFSNIRNPLDGSVLDGAQFAFAYQEPAIRDALQPLLDRYVRGSTVRFDAISPLPTTDARVGTLVAAIRGLEPGAGITAAVGGAHASGEDFLTAMDERVPWMLVTLVVGMFVALFLLFGSIVLPLKAIAMTLLSITASFGALVWIFQEGNLSELLAFDAPGYTVAGTPIVMFAIVVGLSMDYGVLMLSRIGESYRQHGDNTRAVGEGLAATAGVISGAAAIMIAVFASFALADVVAIKALGVGMAIAVLLDATIVRMLLVPATMRLLGDRNWWAPAPLARLADRIGFSQPESFELDDDPGVEPAASSSGSPAAAA